MKPDKILKLLEEMSSRLRRAEGVLSEWKRKSEVADDAVQQMVSIRSSIRRSISKVDSLQASDVITLEHQIQALRETASNPISGIQVGHPLYESLRNVFQDNIGLLNLTAGIKIGLNQLGPEDVLAATPGQKTAAFRFGLKNGLFGTEDQPLLPGQSERDIAMAAIETAIDHGQYVNEELAETNVSPRLRQAFIELQTTLASHKNIVQVGSRAQLCSRIAVAHADELSSSLSGLIVGQIEMVFSALAQFEEWRTFCENSSSLNVDIGSVNDLVASARELGKLLRDQPLVDHSVEDALETVAGWVDEQEKPDRRDVLTLARTLENVWSFVTRSLYSLKNEVTDQSKKIVATAVVGALVLVGSSMVPAISKIPGAHWIETAYTFIKTTLSQPSKVID